MKDGRGRAAFDFSEGTQEEGEPVVGNPPEIINTPTKTEENTTDLKVVNLADADEEWPARTHPRLEPICFDDDGK